MAKNIENSKPKPTKSSWKSPFKSESDDKPKKHLRFNLKPDCTESNISSTSAVRSDDDNDDEDESTTIGTPTKKRKKEAKMELPEAVDELEEEIERQMSSKAEKTNLSVMNVRNILRSVITNKYVVDMVRQTVEEGRVTELPFEPKLTRAKTKELLQQNPAVSPPVVGFLTPVKAAVPDINPEIKLLIDKELSEDSSDEEYNPENEEEEHSDDDDKGDTSVVSDLDSLPPTPASLPAPLTPLQDCSMDEDSVFKVPQENVGQRTRSKLDLNQLPLESLEQAFVPPDITQDMYEQECDNPDWHQFLKEFTQPLAVNETLDDDVDNDPEYNILEDIEGQPVEDKEEMRKDRAVKVTKRELNALMSELFECTDIPSSDDETNDQTSESIAALEESIMKETEDRERREAEKRGIHPSQRELLSQQLRQHVQLTTQHFLQTYCHPLYHYHSSTCKAMLLTLDGLKKSKVCGQEISNMEAAIDTVACWEQVHSDPDSSEKITRFIKNEMEREKMQKRKKKTPDMKFPPELMRMVVDSEAFLYPMLLPPLPFRVYSRVTGPNSFTQAENMLLAICLEQVKETQPQLYHRMMTDVTKLVCEVSIPRSTPSHMAAHIRRLKCAKQINPVKSFFATGESPKILHFVIPVRMGVKLSQQPQQLLPDVWQDYLVNTSEESSVATDSNNCNSKVKCKSSRSKKTNSKIIPDILKNCLSYENGKWYSKTNLKIADETSTLKPTIASTKETTRVNLDKDILEPSSSKIQKCSNLEKPTKVVSFAKPSAHNTVINKYRKKSVKNAHSDKKIHKLNGQLPAKKKKIVIDKSAPPKVKFVLKPGKAYPFKINAECKSGTVAEEKDSFDSVQRPSKNEVAKKTEHTETTDICKNGLLQISVKKTKDVIQKKSIVSAKNKTLNCNGYDEKEKLNGVKLEEESIEFLLNFHLIPKGLVGSCGSALPNRVHNHNSLDKVGGNVEKQSVSDFARTCKYINGVKQPVCEDNLTKPVPSQSVPSTKLRLRSREVTHRRRPPSTVKLKETEDLTCKFNLTKPKTKVPTSIRPIKD